MLKSKEVVTIILIHSKGGTRQIDQEQHNMMGYQIHLMFPGQSSSFYFFKETAVYHFRIPWQNFKKLCHTLSINIKLLKDYPILRVTPYKFETLRYEFDKIRNELYRYQPTLSLILSRLTTSLIEINHSLVKHIDNLAPYAYPAILNSFLELIELHYKQEHHVAYYANLLNITVKNLWMQTQQYMGVPPLKLIHNRLLKEALYLLSLGANPIKTTMIELGFEDPATFSHFFKKQTNMSPSAYQKKHLAHKKT
ncbi:helix-turn-helix domain-containing protein [Sphingobacterium sp.]|jgi:AraC-like DNA-binding protein|uniref:helix-turn-helix domain-containing protein n=1 Tax=Sphingobacterium sp. TaxID=341027 RepID=UPI002FD97A19